MSAIAMPALKSSETNSERWHGVCVTLSDQHCAICSGRGLVGRSRNACKCVLRAVFRGALAYFRQAEEQLGNPTLYASQNRRSGALGNNWSRKPQEFRADFCILARKVLDDFHLQVFRFHFLLGGDWRLCCRRLGCDRGYFFHAVYRIQQAIGKELVKHEVWPLHLYHSREMQIDHRLPQIYPYIAASHGWQTGKKG